MPLIREVRFFFALPSKFTEYRSIYGRAVPGSQPCLQLDPRICYTSHLPTHWNWVTPTDFCTFLFLLKTCLRQSAAKNCYLCSFFIIQTSFFCRVLFNTWNGFLPPPCVLVTTLHNYYTKLLRIVNHSNSSTISNVICYLDELFLDLWFETKYE